MPFKREHKYHLEEYQERLYKDAIFDTRSGDIPEEEDPDLNPLRKNLPVRIRNKDDLMLQAA